MEERRFGTRASMHFDAHCIVGNSGEYIDCEVINISRQGLAIIVCMPDVLNIGSLIELEIQVPSSIRRIACLVNVKWIKDLSGYERFNFVLGGQIARIEEHDRDMLLKYSVQSDF